MLKTEKNYTIVKYHRNNKKEITGTLSYLQEYFSYTLLCGNNHNKKISKNPKNIKSLINNLNKSVYLITAGYGTDFYELKEN